MKKVNVEELEKKAAEGDISSMNELAHDYTMGIGVAVDYNKAFAYLKRAAMLGDCLAMVNLAIYYSQGICEDKNIEKALDLFHSAACQGANIRECVFQYIDKEDLCSLAQKGYPSAEYYYALSLGNDEAIKRDALISSASNKNLALAVLALAFKSYLANLTPNNYEAKKLFLRAIDCGHDYAQMLNQIALTEQQIGIEGKFDICDTVRDFIGEKYKRPFILVRITSKKRAEELVDKGTICFTSIGEYRKVEKPGVGDFYEGTANTKNVLPFWKELDKEAISEIMGIGMHDEYMAHEKIFCLYALEYSEDMNFIFPNIRMRQFGDTAVVIWDGAEFCRRIEKELKRIYGDSIWLGHKRVDYDVIFSKSQIYTEFSKTEPFAWQNEFRFVLDLANGRIERKEWDKKPIESSRKLLDQLEGMSDFAKLRYMSSGGKQELFDDPGNVLISIGNTSDICTMYSVEDFINLNKAITEKAVPYRIDDSSDYSDHVKAYVYRSFIKY